MLFVRVALSSERNIVPAVFIQQGSKDIRLLRWRRLSVKGRAACVECLIGKVAGTVGRDARGVGPVCGQKSIPAISRLTVEIIEFLDSLRGDGSGLLYRCLSRSGYASGAVYREVGLRSLGGRKHL
jgi:hypothetical protein